MNEGIITEIWQGLIAFLIVGAIIFGMFRKCEHDQKVEMICLEKTGNTQCKASAP